MRLNKYQPKPKPQTNKKYIIVGLVILLIVIGVVLGVTLGLLLKRNQPEP